LQQRRRELEGLGFSVAVLACAVTEGGRETLCHELEGIEFPCWLDETQRQDGFKGFTAREIFKADLFPTTIVIKDGIVTYRLAGWNVESAEQLFSAIGLE